MQRLLVLESDLQRGLLRMETALLRERLGWLGEVRKSLPIGRPWLMVGAAVAGWFAVRHWRTAARWLPTALTAWRWVRRVAGTKAES
jgi:hypothetical protein